MTFYNLSKFNSNETKFTVLLLTFKHSNRNWMDRKVHQKNCVNSKFSKIELGLSSLEQQIWGNYEIVFSDNTNQHLNKFKLTYCQTNRNTFIQNECKLGEMNNSIFKMP